MDYLTSSFDDRVGENVMERNGWKCQTSFSAPVSLTVDKYEKKGPELLLYILLLQNSSTYLSVVLTFILSTSNFSKRVGPTVIVPRR